MPLSNYRYPGVYMEEVASGARSIQAVGTSTAAFIGQAPDAGAHLNQAFPVNNWSQFVKEFVPAENAVSTPLSHAVAGFYQNGGSRCYVVNIGAGEAIAGVDKPKRTGLKLLEELDDVSIVSAPGYADPASYEALLSHAESKGDCVAILDPPIEVTDTDQLKTVATAASPKSAKKDTGDSSTATSGAPAGLRPRISTNGFGSFYFPSLVVADPLSRKGELTTVSPSGFVAGIWARTDAERGVHKPPANASVRGALNLTYRVTNQEQADLNSAGVNVIRFFPRAGTVVWGARTLAEEASEWRYLNVRRLIIMIKESILRSSRWVVFEPNDISLWKSIRFELESFLKLVWRDGALMGATPEEAFFVKCDSETNPPEVVDAGQVITLIGVAPVKPAEFVIFRIGQHAGGATAETI
jgi:phage tail sheath protein FI